MGPGPARSLFQEPTHALGTTVFLLGPRLGSNSGIQTPFPVSV